jgi:hypothetical protein
MRKEEGMKYSILIYGNEGATEHLSPAAHEDLLRGHRALQAELGRRGGYASVQLMPTTSAVSVRQPSPAGKPAEPIVTDGPFADTKEQFLGFYVAEFASLEDVLALSRTISTPHVTLEIRPVAWMGGEPFEP